ncbi:RtcB family protein [Clostridium sp. JS66]|uniref:RtcB family protein n=1 Tax=Clostridium sp. JS66 TaxID=3064705 RepID=UPI00298E1D58|nr:RtcB family protein [Clostridium sp. JS66]WPC39380.1 RtcB family protein [Clostridium sp. JS66]
MFTIYNEKTKKPIKIWLKNESTIEESCLEQIYNLSKLPFIYKWVSIMPDTHTGKGMPIGGVIATEDVVIPNAVGVDIGCGMGFVKTNIKVSDIRSINTANGSLIQNIVGDILRNIPVNFKKHKTAQSCYTLDRAKLELDKYESYKILLEEIEAGYFQIGTLGGGNHFIELQEDEEGYLCIMLHSGSRHFGKQVCDYFNNIAEELNKKWYSTVPSEYKLAFLPVDTKEGKGYINWMNLSLDFAYENRAKMLVVVKEILEKWVTKYIKINIEYSNEINCHHNYASLENHYNKNLWIHRKGATRANKGELAVIPGAMGSYSYVVAGAGNAESFSSSSHGAGRLYSRTAAMNNFSTEQVVLDLKQQGVVLGKNNKKDVAEESRFAYKNIDEVMENQRDLVIPVKKLKTIGVVKG